MLERPASRCSDMLTRSGSAQIGCSGAGPASAEGAIKEMIQRVAKNSVGHRCSPVSVERTP